MKTTESGRLRSEVIIKWLWRHRCLSKVIAAYSSEYAGVGGYRHSLERALTRLPQSGILTHFSWKDTREGAKYWARMDKKYQRWYWKVKSI